MPKHTLDACRIGISALLLAAALALPAEANAQVLLARLGPGALRGRADTRPHGIAAERPEIEVAGLQAGAPGYDLLVPAYEYTLDGGASWSIPYQQRFGNEATLRTMLAYMDTCSAHQTIDIANVRPDAAHQSHCRAPLRLLPNSEWDPVGTSTLIRQTENGMTIDDAFAGVSVASGSAYITGGEFADGSISWLAVPIVPQLGRRGALMYRERGESPREVASTIADCQALEPAVAFESSGMKCMLVIAKGDAHSTGKMAGRAVTIVNVETGATTVHETKRQFGRWVPCYGGVLCVGAGVEKFEYDGAVFERKWQLGGQMIWEAVAWSPDRCLIVLQAAPLGRPGASSPPSDRILAINSASGATVADFDPEGDCSKGGALLDAHGRLHLFSKSERVDLVYSLE